MRLVVADTGPINYLVLIGAVDLLPALFASVILPSAVQAELADPDAPPLVRSWIANPPVWLEIHETSGLGHVSLEGLDEGETAAIALASSLGASAIGAFLAQQEISHFAVAQQERVVAVGTPRCLPVDIVIGRRDEVRVLVANVLNSTS